MSAEVGDGARAIDVEPALRDGYEVHRAALRHGLDITLFPRQVLMARRPGIPAELSFVHGLPKSSGLAAVTFAQDKRIRRALLVNAGMPIPKGGVYSIGRGVTAAKNRLIKRIGYPVVVKPAVGDNMTEVLDDIRSERELDAAIDYFWTPSAQRPEFVRAAYGLTETRELGEIEGRVVAPPGFRVLIEQEVSGQYLRFLIIGGAVRSVLYCPGGPWSAAAAFRDVTSETHASLQEMACRAADAVPGLALAAVDIVVAGGYQKAVQDQQAWIVELSERPWLAAHARESDTLSARLGEYILLSHAAEVSMPLDPPGDEVTVQFHAEGATEASAVASTLDAATRELGLVGSFEVIEPTEGVIEGELHGSAAKVAFVGEMLGAGRLDGQRAMLVEERPRQ